MGILVQKRRISKDRYLKFWSLTALISVAGAEPTLSGMLLKAPPKADELTIPKVPTLNPDFT